MNKIMFPDKFGLTQAVLEGHKTMTRRIATYEEIKQPNKGYLTEANDAGRCVLCDNAFIVAKSRYKVGEVVAVAQPYKSIAWGANPNAPLLRYDIMKLLGTAGYDNKVYVKADVMPHRIRITNVSVERLQDISEEDCLKEGIKKSWYMGASGKYLYGFGKEDNWKSPREAFAVLIDKIHGKGTWDKNPWVFVYEFELIYTKEA